MMAKLETSDPTLDQMIWPCECHCCYLRLTWEHDDPTYRYMWIENPHHPRRWRDRLKAAWTSLRGREVGHHEVVLNEATVAALTAYLTERTQR